MKKCIYATLFYSCMWKLTGGLDLSYLIILCSGLADEITNLNPYQHIPARLTMCDQPSSS